MNFLPPEILSNIFKYLDGENILSLTLVCRAFNETISLDASLSKKIQLTFRKLNCCDHQVCRRYEKLKIKFLRIPFHIQMLMSIGEGLTNLKFHNCTLKLDVIKRILVITKNIEIFIADSLILSDVPKKLKGTFPTVSKLKTVKLNGCDLRLFRVLKTSHVETLEITGNDNDECDDLNEFLKVQTMLKDLKISGFFKTLLFTDDFIFNCFQLKSFSISNCKLLKTVFLKSFIEIQAEFLKKLKVCNIECCDFSTAVNAAINLETLEINNVSLNYLNGVHTFQELIIIGNKISTMSKFPQVRRLKLVYVKSKTFIKELSENMVDIEQLEVVDGPIDDLSMPSLKKLILHNVSSIPADFFGVHSDIEILELKNCREVDDETSNKILTNLKNLKSITIESCNITNKTLNYIKRFGKKIEEVFIKGSIDKLNWKILESQKNLKIVIET